MNDQEFAQLMEQRQEELVNALMRAYLGNAQDSDWQTIIFECGNPCNLEELQIVKIATDRTMNMLREAA